jgi:hypothetical protein
MEIRNWEFYESGEPLVGATVKVRDAVLTHPNAGTILASTTTDINGAWAFTGLTDTAKDVEVIWGSTSQYHRWYKGMTRHTTGTIFFEEPQEFKQVASLATAAGAGASILGFKTDGEPIFRSGAAGAETKIATYTGATGVLRASGWGSVATTDIAANAISQSVVAAWGAQSTTSASLVAIPSSTTASITVLGGTVLIFVHLLGVSASPANFVNIQLWQDAGVLANMVFDDMTGNRDSKSYVSSFTPAAGAHTWHLQWSILGGSTLACIDGRLTVVELKR